MILQGTVSSGGGDEWNGLSYQSISLNQGMEDEVEYVNKESIIPDQMIGKEVYDDGSTVDEPCVESINSSQEEEGEDNGNNSFTCEAIFYTVYTCSKSHFLVRDVGVVVVGETTQCYDKPLILSHGMCCMSIVMYVHCVYIIYYR